MNIVDILIVLLILLFGVIGFGRGVFKQTVIFGGELLVLIIAFIFKSPIGNWLCLNLPFFDFGGIFKGVSSINIFVYQLIGFLLITVVLSAILGILVSVTGVIEKILKFTIILGIPSKILGAIVGFIEGFVVVFVSLFIVNQPMFNIEFVNESKLKPIVLNSVPGLSSAIKPTADAVTDIYELISDKKLTSDAYNKEAINIMLKYKVVDVDLIDQLIEKEKFNVTDIDSILNNYR